MYVIYLDYSICNDKCPIILMTKINFHLRVYIEKIENLYTSHKSSPMNHNYVFIYLIYLMCKTNSSYCCQPCKFSDVSNDVNLVMLVMMWFPKCFYWNFWILIYLFLKPIRSGNYILYFNTENIRCCI